MKTIKHILLGIVLLLSTAIGAQSLPSYPLDTIDGKVYYRYTVERGIGLYRVSKNFGVSQEAILQANPQIQATGLRQDEIILIPAPEIALPNKEENQGEKKEENKKETKRHSKQPIVLVEDTTLEQDTASRAQKFKDSTAIRLAFMLPLQADAIKRDKSMDRFYDYYVGALIAINEVQATGQMIEAYTYDIGKTAQKINLLFNDSVCSKVDAIIGPAYAQQVASATAFAKKDSTWILVPFLSSVENIEQNPYVLQFNPSENTIADTLARYLAQYGDSINCVLIETKEGDVIPAGIMALHQALKTHQVPTTTISLGAILTDSLEGAFKPDVENIIIFNTEKYNNLQAVMPHLINGYSKYRITLFSQYSWKDEKIILPQIYTTIFSDSPDNHDAYTQVYQQYFNHTLSSNQPRYDLLGYDQTRHILQLLQHYKQTDTIDTQLWNGIQSDIQYHQVSPNGGYENQLIHIIRK